MIVVFGVRNCKVRRILIESIDIGDGNKYFFKYHNQPLISHCTQIQNIMRAANIMQSRTIQVDIAEFIYEYYNPGQKTVWFRGIKLDSKYKQIDRTLIKRLNIDVGIEKRKFSIAKNKAAKAEEKQRQTNQFNTNVERDFQKERAKRFKDVYNAAQAAQAAQAARAAQDVNMENADV